MSTAAIDRSELSTAPGNEVRALEAFGLRREELARVTGFSLRALADWFSGKTPSEAARRRLHEAGQLFQALARITEPKSLPAWLRAPNTAFRGMTPLQVIENGETGQIWLMIHEVGSGEPG